MTDNVIPLLGGRKPNEPSKDIIASLERLMKQAKAGELIGFAYATVREGDFTATGWNGESGTRHQLTTAIASLNHRYVEALLAGD